MKINILHFRNCRGITTLTGPETYLLDLLGGINSDKFNALIACEIKTSGNSHIFINELRERNVSLEEIRIGSRFNFKDIYFLIRLIKENHIHLIHTHDARSNVIGLLAGKLTGTPMVSFAHGWLNWTTTLSKEMLYATLEAKALTGASAVIVASQSMQKDLLGKGLPEEKIHYIPYGIDTDKFTIKSGRDRIRKEFKVGLKTVLIGVVGRFHPWKGHKYFLEAAGTIVKHYSDARFILVGDVAFDEHDQYKMSLLEQVKALQLEENIIFAGSRNDIPDIMRAIDLLVLPSLREPFGIVTIEAHSCGKPVVATRVGGIPEAMEENVTGLLVQPKDSEELANAILSLLNDRKKMKTMGLKGRKRVEALFSKEAMIRKTEELYEKVVFDQVSGDETRI